MLKKHFYDVFISYSRKDYERVAVIKKDIEAVTQIDCWMDLDGIESGNPKYTKVIIKAINSCPIFLFMLSGSSQQSENALKELDFAYKKHRETGKKVVIVYIEPCQMNDEFSFDYGKADTINWQNSLQRKKFIRDLRMWTNYKNVNDKRELYPTEHNGKYGFVDESGDLVIQCKWEYAYPFEEGFARIKGNNGKWGFIDNAGMVVSPCKWKDAFPFIEGFARVKGINERWGFIDKSGKTIIPCTWKEVFPFVEEYARVKGINERWGFINKSGKVVIPCVWRWAYDFKEGLSPVQDDQKKWGFIDKIGNIAIPCQWQMVWHFCEGMARVKGSNERWGFINKKGLLIISNKWKHVESFDKGLAHVMNDNAQWFYIDKTGKVVRRG